MNKYIDTDKLIIEIKRRIELLENGTGHLEVMKRVEGVMSAYNSILSFITSLQQEQQTDKQIVIITESHGDANIEWDCRSLEDVMTLLKSAESFITDKQVEKLRGSGCGPDYDTTEGRYSHLFKHKQEQPEVDLEGEIGKVLFKYYGTRYDAEITAELTAYEVTDIARHFYELGLNARKEEKQ